MAAPTKSLFSTQLSRPMTDHVTELTDAGTSMGWVRHPYGDIGEIELEKGTKYRPLIMDTALLVRSTADTRCLVDVWNSINQKWLLRSCRRVL